MEKYNNLTFLNFEEPKVRNGKTIRKMAKFMCDCGDISIKAYHAVKCGGIKACMNCSIKKRTGAIRTHGLAKHDLYRKYRDMIKRCENPRVDRYNCYGALGIKVCKEWRTDFKAYYNWCMENGWKKGLSVDRIDVNKDYSPDNCRIVELIEQHFNKRNTIYVVIDGFKYPLAKIIYHNNKDKSMYDKLRSCVLKNGDVKEFLIKHNLELPSKDLIYV